MDKNKKLYVVIREDLPAPAQAVQAGHAVAEWIKDELMKNEGNIQEWNYGTLVYVTVPDGERLFMLMKKLHSKRFRYSAFVEPDLGNERTAIACLTDSNIFDKLKLLGA